MAPFHLHDRSPAACFFLRAQMCPLRSLRCGAQHSPGLQLFLRSENALLFGTARGIYCPNMRAPGAMTRRQPAVFFRNVTRGLRLADVEAGALFTQERFAQVTTVEGILFSSHGCFFERRERGRCSVARKKVEFASNLLSGHTVPRNGDGGLRQRADSFFTRANGRFEKLLDRISVTVPAPTLL